MVINEEKIGDYLSNLNIAKSCGPDGLHPFFLKKLSDELKGPLCLIFNNSISEGMLPDKWKEAAITALHKKGKKDLPSNYRPVSLTSIICKIMEKIIREEIINHMKRNELFSDKQYGFINKRSTTLQLLKLMDEWIEIIEEINTVLPRLYEGF